MFNDKGLDIFFIGVFLVVGGLGVFGILETEKTFLAYAMFVIGIVWGSVFVEKIYSDKRRDSKWKS